MNAAATVSWAVYTLGVASAVTFFAVWLIGMRMWRRRRPDEKRSVRRARGFILGLSGALTLRYLTGVANLIETDGHPADGTPAVVGTVLGVVVQLYLLWMLIRTDAEDDEQGT
jgi:hypothetical protein